MAVWIPPTTTVIAEAAEVRRKAALEAYREKRSRMSTAIFEEKAKKRFGMEDKVKSDSSYTLGGATEALTDIVAFNRAKEHEIAALHGSLLTAQRRASAVGAMLDYPVAQILSPASSTAEKDLLRIDPLIGATEEINQVLRLSGVQLVQYAKQLQRAKAMVLHFATLLDVPQSHIDEVFSTASSFEDEEVLEESKLLVKEWQALTLGNKKLEL